jgi:serine phosphatase RsbU (regulator of sigma subunit)
MDPVLDVWAGDGQRRQVPLQAGRLSVGRAVDNDLAFPDDFSLSRQHILFEKSDRGWTVRDLFSKNGTTVNGQRLKDPVPLHNGDRIEAGKVRMVFALASTAPRVEFVDEMERPPNPSTTIAVKLEAIMKGTSEVSQAAFGTAEEESARRVGALIEAGRELAGHRPLEELFPVILNLALKSVGGSRGAILSIEKDELVTRAVIGGGLRVSNTIKDRVLRDRSSLLIRDTGKDSALALAHSLVMQKVRSLMAVPLQTNDRVTGMIYVDSPEMIRNFTTEDLNLLTVMANTAAVRIEQARLAEIEQTEKILSRELEQAAEIQRSLFPETAPVTPGWEIAGASDPCRAVGGDYYDYAQTPDGRTAIIVADVAGKGLPAALLMSSLEARFMTIAEEVSAADEFMTRLNRGIANKCPGNRFITAFLLLVDPATGEVEFANAGHNPPLLRRASGEVEFIKDGGPVLGILKTISYRAGRIQMQPGDAIVLFSDGITEAPNLRDEEFGEDRLELACARLAGLTATEFIRELRAKVWEHTAGAPQADDVTAMVVRRI